MFRMLILIPVVLIATVYAGTISAQFHKINAATVSVFPPA